MARLLSKKGVSQPLAKKIPPTGLKKAGARKLVSSLVSRIFDLRGGGYSRKKF